MLFSKYNCLCDSVLFYSVKNIASVKPCLGGHIKTLVKVFVVCIRSRKDMSDTIE